MGVSNTVQSPKVCPCCITGYFINAPTNGYYNIERVFTGRQKSEMVGGLRQLICKGSHFYFGESMSARGDIMRLIGRKTDPVSIITTTTYKYTASNKKDIKTLNEGNIPRDLGVAIHVLRLNGHTVTKERWDYEGGFSFDVVEK
jgi:hypothetical protein